MGAPKINCSWHKRFDWSVMCDEYRIYTRSKKRGRQFIPIGWYCTGHRIFHTDRAVAWNKKYFPESFEPLWPSRKPKFKDHRITPREAGLRTRIKNLSGLYEWHFRTAKPRDRDDNTDYSPWPKELTEKFLNLPPTIDELRYVLFSRQLTYKINSQNSNRICCWVPNPDKPGWMKWDLEGFGKLLKQDALKQKEMMEQIIESRTKIPIAQVDS